MTEAEAAPKKVSLKVPDGGWSWVVAACAFFDNFICLGIPLTFGIFFHEELTRMGVSSTAMAWIFNCFNFNLFAVRIFSRPLSDVFSWQTLSFTTASLTALGYICMVFARGPGVLCFLFSIVVGCSAGITLGVSFLVIPHYFETHRGRAGAIVTSGVSAGQMLLPLLLRHLLDEYGFSGACLLFGGLLMNCAVINLLIHPVQSRPMLRGDAMYGSTRKATPTPSEPEDTKNRSMGNAQVGKANYLTFLTFCERIKRFFKEVWSSICKLKHLTLLIVVLSFTFLLTGFYNFLAFLPFAMAARGHPPFEASYCMSAGAVSDALVRFFIIWASDAKWFSGKISYTLGSLLTGISALGTVFVLHNTGYVMACLVFAGLGMGSSVSVFLNLLVEVCGLELYDAGIAASGLLSAVCTITIGPMMGVVRDYTSYEVSMIMTAVLQLMCPALWLLMPLAKKYDKNKFEEKPKEKELRVFTLQPQIVEECIPSGVEVLAKKDVEGGQVNEGFTTDSGRRASLRKCARSQSEGNLKIPRMMKI